MSRTCSAPGRIPTTPSQCDGNTVQTQPWFTSSDGSASYADYAISRRAQRVFFGSSECNLSNECVQYVGENPTNCRLLDAAGLLVVNLERDFEQDHHQPQYPCGA